MAALGAPTYWTPRFFARMISLGAWATTYSLSGLLLYLRRIGRARYIRSGVDQPTLAGHQRRSLRSLGPLLEPTGLPQSDTPLRHHPAFSLWGLKGRRPT